TRGAPRRQRQASRRRTHQRTLATTRRDRARDGATRSCHRRDTARAVAAAGVTRSAQRRASGVVRLTISARLIAGMHAIQKRGRNRGCVPSPVSPRSQDASAGAAVVSDVAGAFSFALHAASTSAAAARTARRFIYSLLVGASG